MYGSPKFLRWDIAPRFIAQALRDLIAVAGENMADIEPDSPRQKQYCESFNVRFRDELLNAASFYRLR